MVYYTGIAKKRPLGTQTQARLTKKNKIILHTMVGSLWGTDSYFMQGGYSGTESHFGVGYDGEILQWQDDDYRADANLEGNDDCISIETADRGTGFPNWNTSGDNVPAWTAKQIEAIALIIATVAKRHNIPLVLITNTEDSTRGIGYHRQGIDPYRTHGEEYSNSYGKVCPGNKRVAQIPQVIARAKQIMAGGTGGEEEEVTPEQLLAALKNPAVKQELMNTYAGAWRGPTIKDAFEDHLRLAVSRVTVRRSVNGKTVNVPIIQEWADAKTIALRLEAQVAALSAVVAKLATGQNLTADEIKAAAKAGADEAIDERVLDADVTLEVAPANEQ